MKNTTENISEIEKINIENVLSNSLRLIINLLNDINKNLNNLRSDLTISEPKTKKTEAEINVEPENSGDKLFEPQENDISLEKIRKYINDLLKSTNIKPTKIHQLISTFGISKLVELDVAQYQNFFKSLMELK